MDTKTPSRWFANHRHLVQNKFLAKVLVAIAVLITASCLAVFYGLPDGSLDLQEGSVIFPKLQSCRAVQVTATYALLVGPGMFHVFQAVLFL